MHGGGLLSIPSTALAADVDITTDQTYNDTTNEGKTINMKASNITLTIGSNGKVAAISVPDNATADYTGNTIIVKGYVGNTASSIKGGVTGMKVYIQDGAYVHDSIRAGNNGYALDVSDNLLEISGGTVNGNVIGGSAYTGNAKGNKVTISGGTITTGHSVYGGYSSQGNAEQNNVEVLVAQ